MADVGISRDRDAGVHRHFGLATDCGKQLTSFPHAAAGVDNGDGVIADHESEIGDGALVLLHHQLDRADVNEGTRSDLANGQRLRNPLWTCR